ncbi:MULTISPECIES: hypothetical protein [Winogradskyella]|uniref:dTDP-4-amino-4,6-dideoxygalactose transaminase n=1 Tax=Winogradskyella thalassocola TaxID=262004 RepID=A0A1G8FXA4_9FLAO|nr:MULTISPECIES: hypothetical protein [Winogradskyella]SDH86779.1 hypothetical protein SAMN04489796_10525 [Winogradskyella thalassocola]
MKRIGGFFELEIAKGDSLYHDDAIKLSTGRACLNYVLQALKPSKVYVPYYCCDALYEPMTLLDIEFEFYEIDNQLEIKSLPELDTDEIIVYCDFFGVKSEYTTSLISKYSSRLIIDNSHSFYKKQLNANSISFTTARKYFGVPDGAFLYIPKKYKINQLINRNIKVSINHNTHSLLGFQDLAYSEFSEYEKSLNSEIKGISILSEKILQTLNYKEIRAIRNRNFNFFREEFNSFNNIMIADDEIDCFCYPLLLDRPIKKEELYNEKIYLPNYWLDTTARLDSLNFEFETKISTQLLPLPIDHRYTIEDLKRVSQAIKSRIQ